MKSYICAIDQGTTQTTVMIVSKDFEVVSKVSMEFPQIYPNPGWVEHDPESIWDSVVNALGQAVSQAGITGAELAAIGITNQRETSVLWERDGGRPIHNAIVWQCRRTSGLCEKLRLEGHEKIVREKTGLVLDPYFCATKIRWILDKVNPASPICFGTIDTFLAWRLTDGESHVTDLTNASRTLLCNIYDAKWDDELLDIFDIPRDILPEIVDSSQVVGHTRKVPGLPDGIPIAGIAGDQQAALFGQLCFTPGTAKCTYGTGAFLMMNTGGTPTRSSSGLLTTVALKMKDRITYALEGSVFIAGAAVGWLRDGLQIIDEAAEIESLAGQVKDSGGVVFVPALTGLGAPHWRPDARGVIWGISGSTTRAHIARACLDGIALQVTEILDAMQADIGHSMDHLKVDGGAAVNNLLMQLQADLLDTTLIRPKQLDTTVMGAALLAGLAIGVWKDEKEIAQVWKEDRRFQPSLDGDSVKKVRANWDRCIKKA